MDSLGTLLPELAVLIFDHLRLDDDLSSLRSLCLVSSNVRHFAEPVLYHNVWLHDEGQCLRLLTNIRNYPRRALGILQIRALWTYRDQSGLEALSEIVSKSPNVREFWFESPLCNRGDYRNHDGEWGGFRPNLIDMLVHTHSQQLEPSGISPVSNKLKKLVLHWQWGCWTSGADLGVLFKHPTLENLILSCANIDKSVLGRQDEAKQTRLRSLVIAECNVDHEGLRQVLRMPSNLENLYLGENNHYSGHSLNEGIPQLLSSNTTAFFEALSQQSGSLRTFSYKPATFSDRRSVRRGRISGDCFAKFESLTSLKIDRKCPDILEILQNPSRRPPLLEEVRMYSFAEHETRLEGDPEDNTAVTIQTRSYPEVEEWTACLAQIPTFRQLEVVIPCFVAAESDIETFSRISEESNVTNSHMRLRVIQEQSYFGGYIPPYLIGEPHPEWILVFDSLDKSAISQDVPYGLFK